MRLRLGMLLLFFTVQGWAMSEFYGPTTGQDHLWHIASANKPSGHVTVQQTMMAIYQANPEAFEEGNINGLRSGFLLHLPALGSAEKISMNQAKQWVADQNARWKQAQQSHQGIIMSTQEAQWPLDHSKPLQADNSSVSEKPLNQLDDVEFRGKTDTEIKVLSQKMADLVQTTQQQKQLYESKLTQLESENHILKAQIANVDQRMNLLAGEPKLTHDMSDLLGSVDAMGASQGIATTQALTYQEDPLFSDATVKTAFGIAVLLLILAACFFWPGRMQAQQAGNTLNPKPLTDDDEDTENEYDFMHSEEGIPAQLDLARAYIDMDDAEAAKEVLEQVMHGGNPQQQHEAKDLLKQVEQ